MNHQPFETWILEEIPITNMQKKELDIHLHECPECYHLNQSWHDALAAIASVPVKSAPAGFTRKWEISLAQRKRAKAQQQARTMLIAFASGAGAIAIAIGALLLPDFSLISLGVNLFSFVIKTLNGLDNFWYLIIQLIRSAPTSTLIITGSLLAGWISLLLFVCAISVWKVSKKGVTTK